MKIIFANYVRSRMALLGIERIEDVAVKLGISEPTMYKRLKDPEGMKIRELRKLAAVLRVSVEELLEVGR